MVLREARTLITAISPPTATAARRLLWAVAPFGVWAHQTVGSFTANTVNARNVEAWISGVNKRQPQGWRNAARAALRQIGRAVNPLGWPDQPDEVGRPPACQPYSAAEEAAFRAVTALPGTVEDPVTPLWVAAASCGAGMRGPEIGSRRDKRLARDSGRPFGGACAAATLRHRADPSELDRHRPQSHPARPRPVRAMPPVHHRSRPQRHSTGRPTE